MTPRLFATILLAVLGNTAPAQTVHFTDFIPDASRTGFMGFESLVTNDVANGVTYQEGGIEIFQVNGPFSVATEAFHPEGQRGWYPRGGDFGYTRLTLVSGADFENVGFLIGTGYRFGATASYSLLNNGNVVLNGTFGPMDFFLIFARPAPIMVSYYLGFSGGGFDEIRLHDINIDNGRSAAANALAIDAIEISKAPVSAVPEPTTYGLFGTALLLGAIVLRRRKDGARSGRVRPFHVTALTSPR